MTSLTVGSTSWESFLHDVWSAEESSDDGEGDEEAVEEAEGSSGDTPALAPLAAYLRSAVDDSVRSPVLAPAMPPTALSSALFDFTFYPSFDEYFALDDVAAASATLTEAGGLAAQAHGSSAQGRYDGSGLGGGHAGSVVSPTTLAMLPSSPPSLLTLPPPSVSGGHHDPHLLQHATDNSSASDFEGAHRRSASHFQASPPTLFFEPAPPATVDMHLFAAPSARDTVVVGVPQRAAGSAPIDPAGLVTPARRKPRLEDLLCRALAAQDLPTTPDTVDAIARLLGVAPMDTDAFSASSPSSTSAVSSTLLSSLSSSAAAMPPTDVAVPTSQLKHLGLTEEELRARLSQLPQSRLLELHSLVHGTTTTEPWTPASSAPASPASSPVARKARTLAGKPRRKTTTGWTKRRRTGTDAAAAAAAAAAVGQQAPNVRVSAGMLATSVRSDSLIESSDDEEIDVVGV